MLTLEQAKKDIVYQGMRSKCAHMIAIQDDLNKTLFTDWKANKLPWNNAIMVEAVELFDHTSWKWWKKNKGVDVEQVNMEAVDILHFLLAYVGNVYPDETTESGGPDVLAQNFYRLQNEFAADSNMDIGANDIEWDYVQYAAKNLIAQAAGAGLIHGNNSKVILSGLLSAYFLVLYELKLNIDDIYKAYIGKVQLNKLRWSNGYGTTYIKIWEGREDNQWLSEFMKGLDVNNDQFEAMLKRGLEEQYNQIKLGVKTDLETRG